MARRRRRGGNSKLARCARSGRGLKKGAFRSHMKSCLRKRR